MRSILIAPCGMNCAICLAYLREKNRCLGCRTVDINKSSYCRKCILRNCQILKKNKMKFCSVKCEKYPCRRLKALDKRYKTKYGTSILENLENIEKFGIKAFLENEKIRWMCRYCSNTICVHRDTCLFCGEKNEKHCQKQKKR